MANYQLLKADIDAKVYQNGKQEITGENLNSILNTMVASLGAGYQFMGMATPTNPGTAQTPDYKCFYLATTPGTYTNLGGLVVADGEVAILKYDSSWHKEVTGAATAEQLNQLGQKLCPGGVNLFNYERRTSGKYLNPNNGTILDLAGYYISDYIYVKGLTTISFTGYNMSNNGGWMLFDANKTRLSYGANANQGITIGDAVYLQVCGDEHYYTKDMVCSGVIPNVYVPFTNVDKFASYEIDTNRYLEQTNPPVKEKLSLVPTTYEPGIFGLSISGYSTSDYIEVLINGPKELYFCFSQTAGDVLKIVFYNKDKNSIAELKWRDLNIYVNQILKLKFPKGCQYIRYAKYDSASFDGVYTCDIENLEDIIARGNNPYYTETNNIVWVGTSIPEGATYPLVASKACGYNCINNSKGSQSLAIRTGNSLCMMYTQQEFYDNFHSLIGTDMTQAEYNSRIDKTFERNVLPFVRGESLNVNDGDGDRTINPNALKVSALIVDHNYNDYVNIATLLANEDNIDWTSRDRTNFVGAMNYLMDEVRKVNPTLKIVLAGYFQNSWLVGGTSDVCKMQSLCAEHFNLEIIETWKYSQINNKIIKGTSGYMAWFNSTYNKNYVVPASAQDAQGNITAQYIYLPDGIHPHSDLTQHCNERLNAIYTKFLKSII